MCYFPQCIMIKKRTEQGLKRVGYRFVACGKCVQCLQSKSEEWAFRCMQEAKQHKENCFLTLTYNPFFLPAGGTLVRKDLQDFLKRLRKAIEPVKIRVFYCGEYGKKGLRPHYHVIVFGWKPKDLIFWQRDKSGSILYRSPFVEKYWSKLVPDEHTFELKRLSLGYSSVGDLTYESAKYCAKYLQKLNDPPPGCIPAFTGQSNRPGIAFDFIKPEILTRGGIVVQGKCISTPRYFMKKLEEGHDLEEYKERKYAAFMERVHISDPNFVKSYEKGRKIYHKLLTKDNV